jgi:transcriptional regulator GlxA family with amidase domain
VHEVAVVATHGVVPFDLATPTEIFRGTRLADGRHPYRLVVCGVTRVVRAADFEIRLRHGLEALARADTVIVPGVADVDAPSPRGLVQALRAAEKRGARIASICSGAFLLAATGLLDGRRATTHWRVAAELARRHPEIEVDANVLFVDEGKLITSAGASAGIDMCLHLVRRDFGAAVAANTARMSVVALEREGGQAQFIVHPPAPSDGESLATLVAWIDQNLHRDLSLFELARRAAMSTRTLSRRFREQMVRRPRSGSRARACAARSSCSRRRATPSSGSRASRDSDSATTLRVQFQQIVGTSPKAYRRAFRGSGA